MACVVLALHSYEKSGIQRRPGRLWSKWFNRPAKNEDEDRAGSTLARDYQPPQRNTRKSIPLPEGTFTEPFMDRSRISPTGSVLPACWSLRFGRSYSPQASDEKTHNACGRSLPSKSPRQPLSAFAD